MKKVCLIVLSLCGLSLRAQHWAYSSLSTNGLRATASNIGALIDVDNGQGGLEVNPSREDGNYVRSVFSVYFNVAGYQNGTLAGVFSNLYSPLESFASYQNIPGPYETKNKYYAEYNRFWKVRKWEILSLIEDYNDDGIIDRTPSVGILTWPGRGNPYSKAIDGISWPLRSLAPFYDRNSDGIYDPWKGDYPVIDHNCPSNLPDEMMWSLYHASASSIEVQSLSYSFHSSSNPIIDHTVFSKIKVVNATPYLAEARAGLFFDFDLGCLKDDYIGTAPSKNTVYAYNQSEFDQYPCETEHGAVYPFSGYSPTQSITCLNKTASGSIIYDRQSEEANTNDPTSPLKFYRYMSNQWSNGTHLTFGGDGYNTASTQKTNFIFPSSPGDENGWSMVTAGVEPGDQRGFLNFKLPNMYYNREEIFDFALALHPPDLNVSHFRRVDKMLENVDKIKAFYLNCYASPDVDPVCAGTCVWPGDTDRNGIVNNLDILPLGPAMSRSGKARDRLSAAWAPVASEDWGVLNDQATDLKHLDCNGNGTINQKDFQVVLDNMLDHNYNYTSWGGFHHEGNALRFISATDTLSRGDKFSVDVTLAPDDTLAMYGLGFTIYYDPAVLELINAGFDKKWLDKKVEPLSVTRTENGRIHYAQVRQNGQANTIVHRVKLGTLKFKVLEEAEGGIDTRIIFDNHASVNAKSVMGPLPGKPLTLHIASPFRPENLPYFDGSLLFPNPAAGHVYIKSNTGYTRAELFDTAGRITVLRVSNNQLHTGRLVPGAYIVRLSDDAGHTDYSRLVVK